MSRLEQRRALLLSAALLTLALACIAVLLGSYPLSLRDMATALKESFLPMEQQAMETRVFWQLRLPRMLMALLTGAVLGVCGGIYQLLFHSSLASPDLTGVASGASLGAAIAIVVGMSNSFARMGLAFVFGVASLGLVLLLVRVAGGERVGTYILAGIVISSLADAGLMILKTVADPERQLAAIEFWTMGSFAAVSAGRVLPFAAIALPALCLLLLFRRPVLMLSLGEDACRSMGLAPGRWRMLLLLLSTLAVSAAVSVSGVIGFVGLTAPHVARLLYRRHSGAFLLLCALLGSSILLVADIAAKSLLGGAELPISIFTVLAGVPVLIFLLCAGRTREV
jgi:iron complex transport system permease protein